MWTFSAPFRMSVLSRQQRPNVRSVLPTLVWIYYRIHDFRECLEIIRFRHTAHRNPVI
jgi:hypothetical protein